MTKESSDPFLESLLSRLNGSNAEALNGAAGFALAFFKC
jgi:hypothetical protein